MQPTECIAETKENNERNLTEENLKKSVSMIRIAAGLQIESSGARK